MKNIIPFKKDVIFKTNLSEITSIALENTLTLKNDTVSGEFIVSGEYKVSDNSTSVEPFELKLPFEIVMDDRYDTKSATIDIDDFYYEIVNDNVLRVCIDVLIDNLKEKPVVDIVDLIEEDSPIEVKEETFEDRICNVEEEDCVNDEKVNTVEEKTNEVKELDSEEKIKSLFNQFNSDSDVYVTYNVFIVREGDNVDSILEKYGVTLDELKEYNDLNDLKIGDKLIIPSKYERS